MRSVCKQRLEICFLSTTNSSPRGKGDPVGSGILVVLYIIHSKFMAQRMHKVVFFSEKKMQSHSPLFGPLGKKANKQSFICAKVLNRTLQLGESEQNNYIYVYIYTYIIMTPLQETKDEWV